MEAAREDATSTSSSGSDFDGADSPAAASSGSPAVSAARRSRAAALEEELQQYASSLGLDAARDAEVLWLARAGLAAPLPSGWSPHADGEGRIYYHSQLTEESSWECPTDALFRDVAALYLALRARRPAASDAERLSAVEDHLAQAHRRGLQQLAAWSGPYDLDGRAYYYNEVLDASSWQNPMQEAEHDLALRRELLRRCLLVAWKDEATVATASASTSNAVASTHNTLRRSIPPPLEIGSLASRRAPPRLQLSGVSGDHLLPPSPPDHQANELLSPCSFASARSSFTPRGDTPVSARRVSALRGVGAARISPAATSTRMMRSPRGAAIIAEEAFPASELAVLEADVAAFAADATRTALELPQTLCARQRKWVKALAEGHPNLRCESFGFGAERRLHLFKAAGEAATLSPRGRDAAAEAALDAEVTFGKRDNLKFPEPKN